GTILAKDVFPATCSPAEICGAWIHAPVRDRTADGGPAPRADPVGPSRCRGPVHPPPGAGLGVAPDGGPGPGRGRGRRRSASVATAGRPAPSDHHARLRGPLLSWTRPS